MSHLFNLCISWSVNTICGFTKSCVPDYRCVSVQGLHPSKVAFEDWMRHRGAPKIVPFRRPLQMQPKNAAFVYPVMKYPMHGSFMAKPIPRFTARRWQLLFFKLTWQMKQWQQLRRQFLNVSFAFQLIWKANTNVKKQQGLKTSNFP